MYRKTAWAGFLAVDCLVNDLQYIFVNVYAPTRDQRLEQKVFEEYVYSNLEKYIGHSLVVGDLNICLDSMSFRTLPEIIWTG